MSAASNDRQNLLSSAEIAPLFPDNALRVRRCTERATAITPLILGALGGPTTDLATEAFAAGSAADARAVLRTLVPLYQPLTTGDGRSLARRVLPHRTTDGPINGLVITRPDVTAATALAMRLRAPVDCPAAP